MLDDTMTTCFETNVVTDFTPLPIAWPAEENAWAIEPMTPPELPGAGFGRGGVGDDDGDGLAVTAGEGLVAGDGEAWLEGDGDMAGFAVGVGRAGAGVGVGGTVCEYTTIVFEPEVAGLDCWPLLRVTMI